MPFLLTMLLFLLGLGVVTGGTVYIIIQRAVDSPPLHPSAYKRATEKRAMVVVLGDIGHSPRMQYHARSLMEHGYHVDMIGYSGNSYASSLFILLYLYTYILSDV
jgi:beta-1,4-mannosyltransferase